MERVVEFECVPQGCNISPLAIISLCSGACLHDDTANSFVAFILGKQNKQVCLCAAGTSISSTCFQGKRLLNSPCKSLVVGFFRELVKKQLQGNESVMYHNTFRLMKFAH